MNELLKLIRDGNNETALELMRNSKLPYYDMMCKLLYTSDIDTLKRFTYFLVVSGYLKEDKV
jgi:hypothetical protein